MMGRSLKVELERAVMTPCFAVSILLPCLFYLASGADELFQLWHSSHVDVLHFADFLGNVGSFSMMLILAACFPCATAYCDDLRHQYLRCQLLRCKTSTYCAAKIITAALVGAVASAGGLLLFILLLGLRFPFTLPGSGLYDSAVMAQATHYWGELLIKGGGAAYFGGMLLCCGLYGALWGAAGIAVSGLIPNPFVALFTPFLLESVLRMAPLPPLLKLRVHLFGHFNLGGWGQSILFSVGYMVLLIFLCGILFYLCVKRRLRDG